MFPIFLKIGILNIHTYGVFIAIAFLLCVYLFLKKAEKYGYDKKNLENFIFGLFIAAIIGARFFYVLLDLSFYLENPQNILKVWEGGLVYWGGFIAAFIYAYFFICFKRHKGLSFFKLADIMVPYLALGHAIGRLGCLSAGCCYGKITDCFLGIVFNNPETLAPLGQKVHPTQLYEFFGNFIIFIILLKVLVRKKFNGQVFGFYLILYPILRFIVEFFRGDERGYLFGVTATQAVSLVSFILGFSVLYYGRKK